MEDGWASCIQEKDKKKVSRQSVVEEPLVDREMGY